jgi:adenosylcobinamide-GDP ribazoletransferase
MQGYQNEGVQLLRRFLIALQFLTIIPLRKNFVTSQADIPKSSSYFVPVGLFQGALLAAVAYAAGRVFDPGLTAGVTLLVFVLSNGGFHLDGLADTFDALAAKGGREKKLSVMKDSTIGPVGVVAIFFSLLIKYLAIKNLTLFPPFILYSSLLFLPAISKLALVISMFYGTSARSDGLGRLFLQEVGAREVLASTMLFLTSIVAAQVFFNNFMSVNQYIFYATTLISVYFICLISVNFLGRKFGGLTGDTLGAISEITEIAFLLLVMAWSRLFI